MQTLGTRMEWNKCYDSSMRMRQLSKIRSQYELTMRVWATFKLTTLCNELWIAFSKEWNQWTFLLILEAEFPFETMVPSYSLARFHKLELHVSSTWLLLGPVVPRVTLLLIMSCIERMLTFRHRASSTLEQAFRYYTENAFYIFNQQIYFIIWYFLDRASLI